jgi:hypothetical protein
MSLPWLEAGRGGVGWGGVGRKDEAFQNIATVLFVLRRLTLYSTLYIEIALLGLSYFLD